MPYIASHYATNKAFLRVAGKPVIFVYLSGGDGCGMADPWSAANTVGFYVVLKVFPGFKNCPSQPESWHQYSPAKAADHQAGFSYAISFLASRKRTHANPVLGRDLTRWAAQCCGHEGVPRTVATDHDIQRMGRGHGRGEHDPVRQCFPEHPRRRAGADCRADVGSDRASDHPANRASDTGADRSSDPHFEPGGDLQLAATISDRMASA